MHLILKEESTLSKSFRAALVILQRLETRISNARVLFDDSRPVETRALKQRREKRNRSPHFTIG